MRHHEAEAQDISIDVEDNVSSHSHSGSDSRVQRIEALRGVAPAALDVPRWLVHVGGDEVFGPVSARQVAEAIKSGRLPEASSIQAMGEVFWTGLLDEPAVVAAMQAS